MNNIFKAALLALMITVSIQAIMPANTYASMIKQDTDHSDDTEDGLIELSEEQMAFAEITVTTLTPKLVPDQLVAPGEVLSDAYSNWKVSVRTPSLVKARHITLGSKVKQGEPLATLFSEEIAQSQSSFLVNRDEWRRVRDLGRSTTGNQRYIEVEQAFLSGRAKLLLLGMSEVAVNAVEKTGAVESVGEYTLVSPVDGIVLDDNFVQGAWLEAGTELAELTDESKLWVEAKIPAGSGEKIKEGGSALITGNGSSLYATVIQQSHIIDHETRTRVIRLAVNNKEEVFHPGYFVRVAFDVGSGEPALAVPEGALMRSTDGDWQVFVEEKLGHFRAQEIEIVRKTSELTVITGVEAGTRLVTNGAFFLASEQAKAGFDIDGH